jgi:NDP-sugar pyrophosphorylase family protein
MRAMILAAGHGSRMQPLSALRPKPALPLRGVPVIAHLLELLARSGVDEVVVNLHHLADTMRETAQRCCPSSLTLHFSEERELLGTGGGIRRSASFLRDSDPALVLAGDMLFDADLRALVELHREHADAATLLLRRDSRSQGFGSVGIDSGGTVRRIGRTLDLGSEHEHGLFVGVRLFAARAFDTLPDREGSFEDLRDWLGPLLEGGARDIRGALLPAKSCSWEPIGTPREYLAANLAGLPPAHGPRSSSASLGPDDEAEGTRIERDASGAVSAVIGAGAELGADVELERAVVWDGEQVPAGSRLVDTVFAGGRAHDCAESPQ